MNLFLIPASKPNQARLIPLLLFQNKIVWFVLRPIANNNLCCFLKFVTLRLDYTIRLYTMTFFYNPLVPKSHTHTHMEAILTVHVNCQKNPTSKTSRRKSQYRLQCNKHLNKILYLLLHCTSKTLKLIKTFTNIDLQSRFLHRTI